VTFTIISRVDFAYNLPLSGDEVGVGVLQATGQALHFQKLLPTENVPISEIKKYVEYSSDKSVMDVFASLRYRGMHPPFYYLLLHYTIRFMNNDVMTLRALSIFFSVLSIILIFFLGKAINGDFLGLLSSSFLALSAYHLKYNVMVRPYPLLMFLSLLSSLLIYVLVSSKKFNFKSFGCYLYILISVIGLYTMYHYLFVLCFQAAFVFLSLRKHVKRVLLTALIYLLIIFLFIPWLPSLFDQLNRVHSRSLYFSGQNNPLLILYRLIFYNFLQFSNLDQLQGIDLFQTTNVFLVMVLIVFLIGCRNMLYSRQSRFVFIALVVYLAAHFTGDWIMDSKTLEFKKFQFFLEPMFFFILAFGFVKMSNRFYIRNTLIFLFSTLLIFSSLKVFQVKSNFDGPEIVNSIHTKISNNLAVENSPALLIVNTPARRFLLPMAHSIDFPIDIMILGEKDIATSLSKINAITQYDTVFVGNLFVHYAPKPKLSIQELQLIDGFLRQEQFADKNLMLNSPEGTLTQFTKKVVESRL
jgi:uncharacterized membrane protein